MLNAQSYFFQRGNPYWIPDVCLKLADSQSVYSPCEVGIVLYVDRNEIICGNLIIHHYQIIYLINYQ